MAVKETAMNDRCKRPKKEAGIRNLHLKPDQPDVILQIERPIPRFIATNIYGGEPEGKGID